MKILILSFYYPPDLSAGSFRVKALENALLKNSGESIHIDIITTMPNRYRSQLSKAPEIESAPNLSIQRIQIPPHKSGKVDQSRAYFSFARKVLKETRGKKWDVVVATSSRLMTGALGAYVATRAKASFYLDIRDLFTDTVANLMANSNIRFLLPILRWLEKYTLSRATRVNLVSAGFLNHAKTVAPQHEYRIFTNGIDKEFLQLNFCKQPQKTTSLPLIFYAGNIGEGQGLHNIIPKVARILEGKAQFLLLGDGGKRTQLEQAINNSGVSNVEILNPVQREQLYTYYRDADILFLHLNDYAAFHKVLPSKIFEYAATGKPIIAGVAGYAAEFFKREVEGVQIFDPCDENGMAQAFENVLNNGKMHFSRETFREKYARTRIMRNMAKDILQLGNTRKKIT